LVHHWIACHGIPLHITSDCCAQFTSSLWTALSHLLGCTVWQTTAYHPRVNGVVERFHHRLKAVLKARLTTPAWLHELPVVLLAIRTTPKQELGCAPAELVYGFPLRLPGEFFGAASLQRADFVLV
jgi:transposase InsO family protein